MSRYNGKDDDVMLKNRNIPFGYCVINGKYAVNEIEADTIRQIFSRYIGGDSLKTIAAQMTVPYNECKPVWNKNMVSRVLENRKYLGENDYPVIVSREDFDVANKIKSTRYIKVERKEIKPQSVQMPTCFAYEPTEEIQRKNSEITTLINTVGADKEDIVRKIFECAEMKYAALKPIYGGGAINA